jgi:hypothetical protein
VLPVADAADVLGGAKTRLALLQPLPRKIALGDIQAEGDDLFQSAVRAELVRRRPFERDPRAVLARQ